MRKTVTDGGWSIPLEHALPPVVETTITWSSAADNKPETILEEAQRLVYGDRQAAYGHPADDYQCTGEMWAAMLRRIPGVVIPDGAITPRIASLMMVAVKLSREVNKPKRDNRVDGAGYFACADLCAEREAERQDGAA